MLSPREAETRSAADHLLSRFGRSWTWPAAERVSVRPLPAERAGGEGRGGEDTRCWRRRWEGDDCEQSSLFAGQVARGFLALDLRLLNYNMN